MTHRPLALRIGVMEFDTRDQVDALLRAAEGPQNLARRMSSRTATFSLQRVCNWRRYGRIPPMIVKAYRPLFNRIMARAEG